MSPRERRGIAVLEALVAVVLLGVGSGALVLAARQTVASLDVAHRHEEQSLAAERILARLDALPWTEVRDLAGRRVQRGFVVVVSQESSRLLSVEIRDERGVLVLRTHRRRSIGTDEPGS